MKTTGVLVHMKIPQINVLECVFCHDPMYNGGIDDDGGQRVVGAQIGGLAPEQTGGPFQSLLAISCFYV
jgi:hypothetical protein